jgi:hypothetical protein
MDNFDFDQVYQMISDMNKSNKEKCLICHFVIENKEIELDCKHQYHYTCFKNNKKCFYCGKNVKITNNKCSHIFTKGLKQGTQCGRILCIYHKQKATNTCKTILQSGINKGNECGRENCKYHKIII